MRSYLTTGNITASQATGDLWLSEVLGPALVVPSYGSVTMALPGTDDGQARIASGLLVGPTQILTCAHVVTDMKLDHELPLPTTASPVIYGLASWGTREPVAEHVRPEVDVAVVEINEPINTTLRGMVFRKPDWTDRVSIFGFPPIPYSTKAHLVVQTGEVVVA